MNKRIEIELPNGDKLVAEVCPRNGGQIAIGIEDKNNSWVQDLAVVETDDKDGEYLENKFNIYVFGSEYDECYTECFGVNRIKEE